MKENTFEIIRGLSPYSLTLRIMIGVKQKDWNNYFLGIYMRTYLCIIVFLTIYSLNIVVFANSKLNRITSPSYNSNPAAEKWILERIAAGQTADLSEVFPDEKERVISSLFLENILTNSVKICRQGIKIFHAVIYDPINLENLVVPYEVHLNYCRFESNVNFSNSYFQKELSFEGCSFKDANFNGLKVDKHASLSKAVFTGSVGFMCADISGQLVAEETSFKSTEKSVNFNGMNVGIAAFFNKTSFAGSADFGHAKIHGNFEASEVQFKSVKEMVNFNGMKVGHCAIFHKSSFEGPVDFVNAEISVNLECHEAQFNNSEFIANFNSMKVGHTAFFKKAVFAGPVSFSNINISCNFEADEAQFKNKEKPVHFNGIKIGGSVLFSKVFFAGQAEFFDANIDGQFIGNEIIFNNPGEIKFIGMKAKGVVLFHKAIFAGLVDFRNVEISGDIEFFETKFNNIEIAANFNTIKVYGSVLFVNSDSLGKIYLSDANLMDMIIKSNKEDYQLLPFLDISRTVIIRRLQIENTKILDMIATSLCVQGDTILKNVSIEEGAKLDNSNFQTISLSEISWPKTLNMNGMTYQHIKAEPEEKSLQILLNMINHSVYSKDVYTNLESFFKRQGHIEKADKVFIEQKLRERNEILRKFSLSWWWNIFWYYFVCYGRNPSRSLWVIAGVIGFGHFLFRRKDGMELIKSEYDNSHYNAFWYSLGVFIPFIDLGVSRIWKPKKERLFARNYIYLHKILGWLLVPVALATFTGIIK